jgi:poly(3-hydroxybutyrate) depolymerase
VKNRKRAVIIGIMIVAAIAIPVAIYTISPFFVNTTINKPLPTANLSFSANGYNSTYLVYADGLDRTKSVGLLIYADGSGEYGLKHPKSSYLLSGNNGLINVAKKHNMVLLTPLSPNKNCADGDGSCWYMGDPPGYAKWAESLVKKIESQYQIDKRRVAFGGYSSGAQLATEWWVPSGAAQRTMTSGVIVAISYGGSPKMPEVAYTSSFKSSVHMNWNVGSKDPSYTGDGKYSVKAGYNHYTSAGFKTSLDIVPGLSHDRDGTFGSIMDTQITKHWDTI